MSHVAGGHEGDGDALGTRSPRAPDPVDVVLRLWRELVIDDHHDILNIEAARGHVGGHHDGGGAVAEGVEDALALALLLVAVDRVAPNLPRERPLERVARTLGRAEDEDSGASGERVDLLDEVVVAIARIADADDALLHVLVRRQLLVRRADRHLHRIALEL